MEPSIKAKIHPVVLLSIIDAYERKNKDCDRVIGTLLGVFDKGVVEVTSCFAVSYKMNGKEPVIDFDSSVSMLKHEKECNKNICPVGWYATGNETSQDLFFIHKDYYMKNFKNPIFLMVDTDVKIGGKISLNVYQKRTIGIPNGAKESIFLPVAVEVESYDAERRSVEMMTSQIMPNHMLRPASASDDLTYLYELTIRLLSMLAKVIDYTEAIVNENAPADSNLGRAIAQLIFSIPKLDPEQIDSLINSSYKDLVMITYLTNLVRTHLKLLNLVS